MKLFLLRHGENEGDSLEASLTEGGRRQMEKAGVLLKEYRPKRVYASAYTRSLQSAHIISNLVGAPIEKLSDLKEFPRDIFFLAEEEWTEEHKTLMKHIQSLVSTLVERNEDAVLAFHAGINRALFSVLFDIPLEKTVVFTQDFGCLNIIEHKEVYGKKRWCVTRMNSTSHLS